MSSVENSMQKEPLHILLNLIDDKNKAPVESLQPELDPLSQSK